MSRLTIELPSQKDEISFNLERWTEISAIPQLEKFEGRIETDRHGNVIMSPPPAPHHGGLQAEITFLLRRLSTSGRVFTECPISTADGVKAADVAWASNERLKQLAGKPCFPSAPEVCVEVLSPGNRDSEITEKMNLYFDAGAREVWLCDAAGRVTFHARETADSIPASALFPEFPPVVRLSPPM